jgi:hypothetical protein
MDVFDEYVPGICKAGSCEPIECPEQTCHYSVVQVDGSCAWFPEHDYVPCTSSDQAGYCSNGECVLDTLPCPEQECFEFTSVDGVCEYFVVEGAECAVDNVVMGKCDKDGACVEEVPLVCDDKLCFAFEIHDSGCFYFPTDYHDCETDGAVGYCKNGACMLEPLPCAPEQCYGFYQTSDNTCEYFVEYGADCTEGGQSGKCDSTGVCIPDVECETLMCHHHYLTADHSSCYYVLSPGADCENDVGSNGVCDVQGVCVTEPTEPTDPTFPCNFVGCACELSAGVACAEDCTPDETCEVTLVTDLGTTCGCVPPILDPAFSTTVSMMAVALFALMQ